MNVTNCDKIQPLLPDFSADNLKPNTAEQVKAHMQACADCRAQLAQLVAAGRMVEQLAGLEPPTEIWRTIQARGERFFRSPAAPTRLRFAFASAVMALLIFAISVVMSLHFFQPQPLVTLQSPPSSLTFRNVEPVVAHSGAMSYFNQHAATAAQDPFADPVSLGLVAVSDDTSGSR
jgi:hypothetical protein